MSGSLRTGSSMVRGWKRMSMVIFIKGSLSMDCVKVVVRTCGRTAVSIMATLNKGIETATAYGRTSTRIKCTKGTIC
jgi:hypothetical protein